MVLGQKISHYRVEQKLGGDAMGVVYRAEDIRLGRHLALKFLREDMMDDAQRVSGFSAKHVLPLLSTILISARFTTLAKSRARALSPWNCLKAPR
jgi:serine/threonine protein kinase